MHHEHLTPNKLERPVDLAPSPAETSSDNVASPRKKRNPGLRKDAGHLDRSPEIDPATEPTFWQKRFPKGLDWPITLWMTGMHVGAVVALWNFSWVGLIGFAVLHFVTACLGITLGYHRLLTHGSFQCPQWFKYFCGMCGMLSAEGSPLMWVANHRKHHVLSDQEGDPHSPNDGFWWSHMLWFQPWHSKEEMVAMFQRWAPDLWKDAGFRFLDRSFVFFSLGVSALIYGIGEYFFDAGLSVFLWAMCLRTVVCYHCTWFVNSASHMWGYRNYETTDRSRNLWWVALLSYGEGWHNNHHAHQRLAPHGHRWYEFDVTYGVILLLEKVGIAWNVQRNVPKDEMLF